MISVGLKWEGIFRGGICEGWRKLENYKKKKKKTFEKKKEK